jgi:hypothetical protein
MTDGTTGTGREQPFEAEVAYWLEMAEARAIRDLYGTELQRPGNDGGVVDIGGV